MRKYQVYSFRCGGFEALCHPLPISEATDLLRWLKENGDAESYWLNEATNDH